MWHVFFFFCRLIAPCRLQAASCRLRQCISARRNYYILFCFFLSNFMIVRWYRQARRAHRLQSSFLTLLTLNNLTKASSSQIVATLTSLHLAYMVIAQPVRCESQTNAFFHYCSFETFCQPLVSLFLLSYGLCFTTSTQPPIVSSIKHLLSTDEDESQTKNRPDNGTPFFGLPFLAPTFTCFPSTLIFSPLLSFSHHFSILFLSLLPFLPISLSPTRMTASGSLGSRSRQPHTEALSNDRP